MKIIKYSDIEKNIDKCLENGCQLRDGASAAVIVFNEFSYAYKEYFDDVNSVAMERHIKVLFSNIVSSKDYNRISNFAAIPNTLVYDEHSHLKGYTMDCIPNDGYMADGKERTLRRLLGSYSDITSKSDLKEFSENLISAVSLWHDNGYILGDVLSPNNILVRVVGDSSRRLILPYFIDMDSCRIENYTLPEGPGGSYNTKLYEPPEGDTISTFESDVYKLSLILSRIFYTKQDHQKAGYGSDTYYKYREKLNHNSSYKNYSLENIGDVFNENLKKIVWRGLSTQPYERPNMLRFEEAIKSGKLATKLLPNSYVTASSSSLTRRTTADNISSTTTKQTTTKPSTSTKTSTTQNQSSSSVTTTSRPASRPGSKATTVAMKPKPKQRKKTVWERFMKSKITRWGVIFIILFLVVNFYGRDPLCLFGVADVDPNRVWLRDGQSVETNVLLHPDSYNNEKYTFELSEHDKNIVSVSDDGVVTANKFDSGDAFDFAQIHIIPANEPKAPSWLQKENKGITCIVDNHDKVKPYKEGKTKENNEIVISGNWDKLFDKCEFIDYTFFIETDKDVNIRKIEFFTRESEDDEWDKLGTKESSDEGSQYITNSSFTFDGDNAISTKKLKLFRRNVKEIKVIYTLENETNYKLWIRATRR